MLAEIFLAKYPMYSCKIKKSSDYVNKKAVAAVNRYIYIIFPEIRKLQYLF